MAVYSGTPLVAKFGIKAGAEIHVAGAPDGYLKLKVVDRSRAPRWPVADLPRECWRSTDVAFASR